VGQYRVYYQAKGFGEGRTVTAKVWQPDGQIDETPVFEEIGDGCYQLDYAYSASGRYLWLVRENGVRRKAEVLIFGAGSNPPDDPMADTLVVSVAEAKQHMRVTSAADDSYIESLILAVQSLAAAWQGRTWLSATLTQVLDAFPPNILYLRYPPATSITSIVYLDESGDSQTLAASVYRLDATSEPARVTLAYSQTWPATYAVTNAITVTYVAGYASAALIPATWKQAVLLGVGHYYEHRESVTDLKLEVLPMGFYDLLWPDRCFGAENC